MKQNYFIYNNKTYHAGTIIIINKFDHVLGTNKQIEATFCYYLTDKDLYVCKVQNAVFNYKPDKFYNAIISVTDKADAEYTNRLCDKTNSNNETRTFANELEIDGMLIAWIWYVFIMALAIIFKDRIAIWIFTSAIFFSYRKKKIKGGSQ